MNHLRSRSQHNLRHMTRWEHARDELGISETLSARPVQAALASAGTFAVGAVMPLLMVLVSPERYLIAFVAGSALAFLVLLGAVSAHAGGAPIFKASARVAFWGPWLWR